MKSALICGGSGQDGAYLAQLLLKLGYTVGGTSRDAQTSSFQNLVRLGIPYNHESPLRPEQFVTQKIVSAACRIASGSEEHLYPGDISVVRDWGWAPEYVEAMYLMLQQEQPDDYAIALRRKQ